MAAKIKCPHCKDRIFDSWQVYAEHILKTHEKDLPRCEWARHALEDMKGGVPCISTLAQAA
jgi:uncharacterized C2H2 Zn-finger protein